MRVNKMIAAATLPAMIASPVAAANPAASLSLRGDVNESATSTTNDDSAAAASQPDGAPAAFGGVSTGLLVGGLAVVLVVVGAIALGSGHHNSNPASA